jgi:hypothetical protein
MRLLAVAVLAAVLALCPIGNVLAVPQVTLTEDCGPPGSQFVLHATPYLPLEQLSYSPDVFDLLGCDSNGGIGCTFIVRSDAPPGHYVITYTDQGGSASVSYDVPCPTLVPVGGFMDPVNKLGVFAPYLVLFGVMAVVVLAVAPWKKREN